LGDDVDGIDVVEALDPVLVALVDGIDADEAGLSLRRRRAAHADAAGSAVGLDEVPALLLVEGLGTQVVQMGDGDAGQSGVAGITIQPPGPFQEHPRGGS